MKRIYLILPLLLAAMLMTGSLAKAESHVAEGVTATETHSQRKALDARDSAFSAHEGTWLNWVARKIFYGGKSLHVKHEGSEAHIENPYGVYYDYIIISILGMIIFGGICWLGAKQVKVHPGTKPMSFGHLFETAVEGFYKFCISVMGYDLATKYTPLIASFFFTILFFNWIGLIPGLISPTANPNVPFGMAIVGFFCVHFIAIREAGFKSYVMHYVGEPLWLAPFNVMLHIISELVKPVSLAMRLLGNIFGDETVVAQFALLGIALSATLGLPSVIALQFPMMIMGTFMGLLQALIFAVLLAIYIAIFAQDHGDSHDEHNELGTTEEVRLHGHQEIVVHPSEQTWA